MTPLARAFRTESYSRDSSRDPRSVSVRPSHEAAVRLPTERDAPGGLLNDPG